MCVELNPNCPQLRCTAVQRFGCVSVAGFRGTHLRDPSALQLTVHLFNLVILLKVKF